MESENFLNNLPVFNKENFSKINTRTMKKSSNSFLSVSSKIRSINDESLEIREPEYNILIDFLKKHYHQELDDPKTVPSKRSSIPNTINSLEQKKSRRFLN
ncbi:uncharacterized protein LOC124499041 [Dermatophagoides farinae]|uniref:Uncharacterized protein n=1 Tax=Dermatophagoides farinae TaxID=6954 RepID=A0A922I0R9_DERFA|nr:DET1- and DDB1-associated protein 1-like [Dermatophagoides farinae]KAH7645752.1 hypothetical protein HUG17_1290 [Dermatophagoides farinae]KAH9515941.1 hypothetical protein DERF_006713 [Dermatophagoides farinae]